MDTRITKHIKPNQRKFINDAWEDDDGFWLTVDMGHKIIGYDYGSRTVHEDTLSEMIDVLKNIKIITA